MSTAKFILEHSKITHRWRCSTSGVWGSWLWLFFHHDGDSTLSASMPPSTPLSRRNVLREQAVTVTNSWLEIPAIGPSRERHVVPTALLTSIQDPRLLCSSITNRALPFCDVFLSYLPQFPFKG